MAALEAQRAILGDAVVDSAVAALRDQIVALEKQEPPDVALAAKLSPSDERRLITIVFTDVVGSTSRAEKLDPEEWRQSISNLYSVAGNVIAKHQGSIVQYLGDGLLALFGAQGSSETDAENAIRAALEIQNLKLKAEGSSDSLQLRIGIHTGLVVLGELGGESHKEFTAIGDPMNLAARLQSAALPGSILISQDTYRYVRGVFDVTPQPPVMVKGKGDPIQTFLVRRAKPRAFRSVTRGVAGVQTRTFGRDAELKQLQEAYLDAYQNHRVAWAQLVGDPGVGKSRVIQDTDDWMELRAELVLVFRARAFASDVNQPFALIRRMWFDRFQIAEDAPLAQAEAKWVEKFKELTGADGTAGELGTEAAHALGLLVGLPFNDSPHIGAMRNDPAQVKGRAFVVSRKLLNTIRATDPTAIFLEDLQWADASSLEYLSEVVLSNPPDIGNGLFVLATARPEWSRSASLRDETATKFYLEIQLAPLSDTTTHELARELMQNVEGVPNDVLQMIVERSEGVPYFAEEMVNWFLDRNIIDRTSEPWRFVAERLRESPLPATLQHLLLTRISALTDSERAVLQRGAIFGRNFWTGGVEALGVQRSDDVLGHLQPRGFVEQQPESSFEGEREWSFHHNLLREVTYESVLKRERAALHKAAAKWLEQQAQRAGRLGEFAGLLGEHTKRAGELGAAADWYVRAGELAKAQGATNEAKKYFDRALDLLPPIEREQRWRALEGRETVLSVLGESEMWRDDLAALLEVADELNDDNRRADVYHRQADFARKTGDYRTARQAADESIAAARRAQSPLLEAKALSTKAGALMRLGEINESGELAHEAFTRASALNDERTLALTLYGVARYYGDSGDHPRAVEFHIRGAELEHRLGNRVQEGVCLGNAGVNYLFLGLYKEARSSLEQAVKLAASVGARRSHAYNTLNLGDAYFLSGDGRMGRKLIEQALVEMAAIGDAGGRAVTLRDLAIVMERSGDIMGAMRRFAEAKDLSNSINDVGAAHDCVAGLARCALARGELDHARQHVNELWKFLSEHGAHGIDFPVWAYETCAEVFDALNDKELSRAALEVGHRELMERVNKISEVKWRKAFLENVRENRAMIEMFERLK